MKKTIVRNIVAYTTAFAIIGTGCVMKLCRDKSNLFEQNVITYSDTFVDDDFMIAAHRGFSSVAVENTLESLELADATPYVDFIELDARLTDDGEIICSHDSFVRNIKFQKWYLEKHKCREAMDNRFLYSNVSLFDILYSYFNPNEGTIIQKRQLDLLGSKFSLATLEEALSVCQSKTIIIDLKFNDDFEVFISKLYELIKDVDGNSIILQSSNLKHLAELQKMYPEFTYSAIVDDASDFDSCSSFQMIGIKKSLISDDWVDEFINQGKLVSVWTVNSTVDLKNITDELGEHYDDVVYITDYPDVLAYNLNNIKLEKKKVTTQ